MIVAKNERREICRNCSFFSAYVQPTTKASLQKSNINSNSESLKRKEKVILKQVDVLLDNISPPEIEENIFDQNTEQVDLNIGINDHESDNVLEESFSSVQGGNISNLINNEEESKIDESGPRYPVRGNRTEPASYRDRINKPRQTISPAKQKKKDKREKKSSAISHLDGSVDLDASQNEEHMETEYIKEKRNFCLI